MQLILNSDTRKFTVNTHSFELFVVSYDQLKHDYKCERIYSLYSSIIIYAYIYSLGITKFGTNDNALLGVEPWQFLTTIFFWLLILNDSVTN